MYILKNFDVWFTSDTHFRHNNIIKYENRPFKDTEEMDRILIDNWNRTVKDNDIIFHLGDICIGKAKEVEETLSQLKGRKILIRGNHDKGISNGKFNKMGFDVHNQYIFQNFLLTHHPQQETALRSLIDNTDIIGNVHGHVHSKIDHLNQDIYKCVAVELINYTPIHLEEVYKHFNF